MSAHKWRKGSMSGCDVATLKALQTWEKAHPHRAPSMRQLGDISGYSVPSTRDSVRRLAAQGLANFEPHAYCATTLTDLGRQTTQEAA